MSSAFKGRDLAIIKALINLKNQYGDVVFEYEDDSKSSQLLIIKDYLDDGAIFYGLNQVSGARIAIKPDLNPNTLRKMFVSVANDPELFCPQQKSVQLPGSVAELIMQEVNLPAVNLFRFKSRNFDLIFDVAKGAVLSEEKISRQNIIDLHQESLQDTKIDRQNFEKSGTFCHSYCLILFLWRMGFNYDQNLIQQHIQKDITLFKQISWPNYGKLDFENDFILLSAKLWKSSHNYEQLLSQSGVEEKIINKFLNANLLAGYVSAIAGEHKFKSPNKKTVSRFIKGLKQLFTKNKYH